MNAAGSVFAFAPLLTPEMTRVYGVVASAPTDWAASDIMPMFACFALGSSAVLVAAGDVPGGETKPRGAFKARCAGADVLLTISAEFSSPD